MLTKARKLIIKLKALRMIDALSTTVEDLEARLSIVEGRSSINAERVVRTHASVQNLAEDVADNHEQAQGTKAQEDDAEEE